MSYPDIIKKNIKNHPTLAQKIIFKQTVLKQLNIIK